VRDLLALPKEVAHLGAASADIQRFQVRRGDFGPIEDVEADVQEWLDRRRGAPGLSYTRWTPSGRFIEYTSRPLPNGEIVAAYRDITDYKRHEQELAAAKEEAERARAESARALERLQVVIDNMSDGVMLFDREMRWAIDSQKIRDLLALPKDIAHIGARSEDIVRFQIARGDHGPVGDVEADVRARLELRRAGPLTYSNRTVTGRVVEFNSLPLPNGEIVASYRDITDLKRNEEELAAAKEAAERARATMLTVLENLTDGVAMYDESRQFLYRNAAMGRLYGISEEALDTLRGAADVWRYMAGRGDYGAIDDIDAWVAQRMERLREPDGTPSQVVSVTGRIIEMSYRALPGNGLLSVHRDITELKHVQAEAEQARNRLEDAIRSLPSGFSLHDNDARLVVYNDSYERYFGNTPGLLQRGARYEDLLREMQRRGKVRPEHRDRGEAWIAEMAAHHRSSFGDREMATADERWIRISKHPTRDGGVVTLVTDLTEAKARERDLARAQADAEEALTTARKIIENMPIGAALVSADNVIRLANHQFTELLGLPAEFGTEGRAYVDALAYISRRGDYSGEIPFDVRVRDFFARIRAERDVRYERTMPDGRHVDFHFTALADGGFLGTYVDITESRRQQEALARARADAEGALSTARTIIEMTPVGVALIGGDRRIRMANRRFTEFLDLPREHGEEGRPYIETMRYIWNRGDFGGGDFDRGAADFFARLHADGGMRYEREMPKGRRVDFSLTSLPDGGFLGTYVDITEARRNAEVLARARDEASEARRRLVTAMESMADGIAFLDTDERLLLCNEAYRGFMRGLPEIVTPGTKLADAVAHAGRVGAAPPGQAEAWTVATLAALRAGEITLIPYGPQQWARVL
ncbi:MAG: PAS-domain containing protein, partial [Reyranellaceae bacterium]